MAKKIAIQLFGHVRTFKDAAPHFAKNVIEANCADGYEVDIFIHTWDEVEHNTTNYRISGTEKLEIPKTDEQELRRIYNPVAILIEPQLLIEEKIIIEKISGSKRSIKGIYNNAYTTFMANQLRCKYEKETGATYDWVIQTRPDILFISPFHIDDFFKKHRELSIELDRDALYFAHNIFNCGAIKLADPRMTPGTDLIYFGTPGTLNRATALFNNFNDNLDVNNFWTMEIWWMEFWKQSGLHPIIADYKFRRDWLVLYKEMLPQLPVILRNHNKEKQQDKVISKIYIKLFNFIPLLKIKRKGNGYKIYLFNFIPFIRTK
ncbi:MAG: hypothetical protein LBE20_05630 [Deltaproteobacteria bacterium]|nr:hypothetical protein [Deltaproteobacteria bacterium]